MVLVTVPSVFRRAVEHFPAGLCLCHRVCSCCSHPAVMLLAPVREIDSHCWFHCPCCSAGSCPCWSQYRHNSSVVCLASFTGPRKPGANQCLPFPDGRLLSIQALRAYVSVKYRAVISVLPRLGVFAPA